MIYTKGKNRLSRRVRCSILLGTAVGVMALLLSTSYLVHAYEVPTHVKITEQAISEAINYWTFVSNFQLNGDNSIKEGSEREDDLFPLVRPRNHFYDPTNGQGLCTLLCSPSLAWGYKYGGFLPATGNDYSWTKAREYMYIALTGKNFNGDTMAATAGQRNENFQHQGKREYAGCFS